jgi:beta-galactosidase
MEKSIKMDKLTLGVCYYPEHWKEELWEDDLKRMGEHGIEVIRIAEFAWNKFEPQEGVFTYDFFDRFLDLAHKNGMKVIFCTPTATPPAWLTHKYPEVLNASIDGTKYRHGMRRHYNYNSPVYREFVSRIVEKITEHYCPHPAIIGWQIDNELNCETDVFYSESDHKAFREYLKNKFKTLDALNEAMGTLFWNQTYTDWDEVHLTRPTIHEKANNPHMSLEEKRFISYSTISFCKLQADIIRKYKPEGQFITTNGIFGHLDSHEMTDATLDFITFDSYPNFAFDTWTDPKKPGNLNDRNSAWSLTRTRSISPNFGIMEQQSGSGGWDIRMKQPAPKPGQMRLWTLQSVAHGADFISYFRWRTCWIGTEIYWHGLNDYSNEPNRRLAELKNVKDDFAKIPFIAGSKYNAKVAFMKDYDNEWDGEQDKWHGPLDQFSCDGWFKAAQLTHTPMDFVYLRSSDTKKTSVEELGKYDLLVYPHATILTKETAELLKAYVSNGGKLIMGSRTGYKDEFGRCPMRPMPGLAGEICGVKVSDYTHLGPNDDAEYAVWDGEEIEAPNFNDILEATGNAHVLATFKGNYYDGAPALVANEIGKGTAYYFGAGFSEQTAAAFLRKLGFAAPYSDIVELPAEAELAVRVTESKEYIFVLNYMPYSIEVKVKRTLPELFTGKQISGKIQLEKYGVLVLENSRA